MRINRQWKSTVYGKSPEQYRCHCKKHSEGIPDKSLCLIPQRFQIAMVDQGWICRNTIIWYKPNCMPSSAHDRFTVDFEYLFFFTKSQRYYFETQYEPILTDTVNDPHWKEAKREPLDLDGSQKHIRIPIGMITSEKRKPG